MWNTLGEVLKVFVEKHLVPTVMAVVGALAGILLLPENFWMLQKLGKTPFFFLLAGIIFLAVQLLIFLGKGISQHKYSRYLRSQNEKYELRERCENIDNFLSFIDRLSPDERELIRQFIRTDNKPIAERGYRTYRPDSLFSTAAIVSTKRSDGYTMYKLNEQFYVSIKAIYEERGSISHFD